MAISVARKAGLPIRLAGPIQGVMGDPEYFQRHIRPHVDGDRVQYVGEVGPAQRLALYQGAKALLAPLQWREPFGLTLIEGMACGTPVIAFPQGSPEELIADGVSGYVAHSPREMVERIGDVARLAPEKVRAHVTSCFSVDRMVDGYVGIYEGALARSRSHDARS